jgi:uncharacterized membrane protein
MTEERSAELATTGEQQGSEVGEDEVAASTELTLEEREVIEGVISDLPPRQRTVVQRLISRSHQGPLPDPETFAAYEVVHPGAAGEILAGARENREHRFAMDRKLANTARLSLILTWAAVVGCLLIGLVLGLKGQPVLGGMFGAGGLAPVFIGMLRGGGRWGGQ